MSAKFKAMVVLEGDDYEDPAGVILVEMERELTDDELEVLEESARQKDMVLWSLTDLYVCKGPKSMEKALDMIRITRTNRKAAYEQE